MLFHRVERCQELRRNIQRDSREKGCVQTVTEGIEDNGIGAAMVYEIKDVFLYAQECA